MSEGLQELIEIALLKHEDYRAALRDYWREPVVVDTARRDLAAAITVVLKELLDRV